MKPCLLLGALALLIQACADPDASPDPHELAEPAARDATCRSLHGTWRVMYEVADPGSSCALLVRDVLQDFDTQLAPGRGHFGTPHGATDCKSELSGPDESCQYEDRQYCSSTLGGTRYDSMVSRSFRLVSPDRLEGSGTARGASASLGWCQTRFTMVAEPE